jgi:Flp pilus assembly protein TadG
VNKLLRSPQRGQSLVEFAMIIPIFLLLAVVIFDLGRGVYYYSTIHNAAREGARYGSVNKEDWSGMRDTARNYAVGLGLTAANITYTGWGPDEIVNNYANPTVEVSINYTFTPATPLVSNFLDGGVISLTGNAIMRTEYYR